MPGSGRCTAAGAATTTCASSRGPGTRCSSRRPLAAGRARVLEPGSSLETTVAFVLFDGIEAVSSVDDEGARIVVR